MAVTEDDLQAKREKLQALRDRRENAVTKRLENEELVGREIESKQLDAEIQAEEAAAARAERIANRTAIRAGVAPIAETIVAEKKEAATVAKAQAKAADQEGK